MCKEGVRGRAVWLNYSREGNRGSAALTNSWEIRKNLPKFLPSPTHFEFGFRTSRVKESKFFHLQSWQEDTMTATTGKNGLCRLGGVDNANANFSFPETAMKVVDIVLCPKSLPLQHMSATCPTLLSRVMFSSCLTNSKFAPSVWFVIRRQTSLKAFVTLSLKTKPRCPKHYSSTELC